MPRYRTTLRPAGWGGLPSGILWHYVELPSDGTVYLGSASQIPVSRHRYGVIETDRELTPAELEHFDIIPVTGEHP